MTDILLMGDIPEFASCTAMLRASGIDAVHRPAAAAGGIGLVARAVVCDAGHAEATLASAQPATPCIVVLDHPSPVSIQRWLDVGAAACFVRPFPVSALVRGLTDSLAFA